jgi:hypothetical protein
VQRETTPAEKSAAAKALRDAEKSKIPAIGMEPESQPADDAAYSDGLGRTVMRAGYWRMVRNKDGETTKQFMVLPETWKDDVCKGLRASDVAALLDRRGYLDKGEGRNLAKVVKIGGVATRLICVSASILG